MTLQAPSPRNIKSIMCSGRPMTLLNLCPIARTSVFYNPVEPQTQRPVPNACLCDKNTPGEVQSALTTFLQSGKNTTLPPPRHHQGKPPDKWGPRQSLPTAAFPNRSTHSPSQSHHTACKAAEGLMAHRAYTALPNRSTHSPSQSLSTQHAKQPKD